MQLIQNISNASDKDVLINSNQDIRYKTRILIASHKPYWTPDDSIYLPVLVGAAGKDSISGFKRDDIGENISKKNPNYCELTALYWAWKNLNSDYVGLVHYRRYFAGSGKRGVMTGEDYATSLANGAVIVPKKRRYYIESVYNQYIHAHNKEPLEAALRIITSDASYRDASNEVMRRKWLYLYNMFAMDAGRFNEYSNWLFPILEEVDSQVDTSSYSQYESRALGFLGERLFNIWLLANDIPVCEKKVISLERQNWPKKIAHFLQRKFTGSFKSNGKQIGQ